MRGTPSLNALRAYEATVRLGSMSAAAAELGVTHGAVSRHVRGLEAGCGVRLLSQGPGPLLPTEAGRRLAEGLAAAFALIAASLAALRPGPLTLSCSATVTMNWLIPRIARFYARHPAVALQMHVGSGAVDFAADRIGVALRSSQVPPPRDAVLRDAVAEWIGPVCSPAYLASNGPETVADLAQARLLETRTRPGAWEEWRAAAGAEVSLPPARDAFEHFYLLIQAACCGLGVAAAPRMLVQAELDAGRLVAPFGFVAGPRRLVLWLAPHLAGRPEARALSGWIVEELTA